MANLAILYKQIESLRSKLYEAVSNKELLSKSDILKYSQDLDKLILKYYYAVSEVKR